MKDREGATGRAQLFCSCARERKKLGARKGEGVRGNLTPTTLNPKD